jgi:hypothetical protein
MDQRVTTGTLRNVVVAFAVVSAAAAARAPGPSVLGRVAAADGRPLPGVTVTLQPLMPGPAITAVTNDQGRYAIAAPPGRYRLRAELAGFRVVERPNVIVSATPLVVDLTLALAFEQQITVTGAGPVPMMGEPQPDAPVAVTREVIDSAMLPNSQYDDVLTLMPNVLRGPDGLISIAGANARQGALFVNGFNATDPTTGEAGVLLPIEAVEAAQVYSGGYAADLGPATGGVTTVTTRSGADEWHMSLNSFFPRLFLGGPIHGVEYWDPNFGVSGPIVKGRLYIASSISYRYDRNRFDTLVGPQDSKYTALLSWTQLDAQVTRDQRVTATLSFDPQRTDRANITAFTPADSVPRLDRGGWSLALADRMTVGQGSLELRASAIHTGLSVQPNGTMPYDLGHDLVRGSYFDDLALNGTRREASAVYTWSPSTAHLVTFGAGVDRARLDGTDGSAPVDLLRSDGTVSREILFPSRAAFIVSATEGSVFAQDSWRAAPRLRVDAGVRVDRTSAAVRPTLSPRVAWTLKLGGDKTLSGGAGLFADKIALEALAFPLMPPRQMQTFDAAGAPAGAPATVADRMTGPLHMPRAERWDVEFDDHFADGWLVRLKYQERHGHDELIVNPLPASNGTSVLALDSSGASMARSVETTVGYRTPRAHLEGYVSYVRSAARGDLNTIDALNEPFKEAFVQPNQVGPLPTDVPNRLLAWGLFRLPARVTIAPFVEVRDGFTYSAIDDTWAYVGQRDGYRLPWFGSLDVYVNKIVGLPGRLPDARIGLKLYNLAAVHSTRDVQRDIQRADFGTTYNPTPRDFSFVFELLWGRRH